MPPIIQASLMPDTASASFVAVGTPVPSTDLFAHVAPNPSLLLGLALIPVAAPAIYPVVSTDGGNAWRVDGPQFYIEAADGPNATSSIGALGSDGAYAWGDGGNVIKLTTDGGTHWWEASWDNSLKELNVENGAMRVVELGSELADGLCEDFLYTSTDLGYTWHLDNRLPDMEC